MKRFGSLQQFAGHCASSNSGQERANQESKESSLKMTRSHSRVHAISQVHLPKEKPKWVSSVAEGKKFRQKRRQSNKVKNSGDTYDKPKFIAIMIPKKNRRQCEIIPKSNLGIQHGLLRALFKINRQDYLKNNKKESEHDRSLRKYSQNLSKLKDVPFVSFNLTQSYAQLKPANLSIVSEGRSLSCIQSEKTIIRKQGQAWARRHGKKVKSVQKPDNQQRNSHEMLQMTRDRRQILGRLRRICSNQNSNCRSRQYL